MIRAVALAPGAEAAGDHVALAYAERYRRRGRLTTAAGLELFLDLPEVVELPEGAALLLADGRRVSVCAAPEPVALITAPGPLLARIAWHLGNRHTPAEIGADRILIQPDHVLEDLARRLGGTVAPATLPFRPEGGAYGRGRTHGHSHGDADHDPNAHIPHRHG